MTSYSRMVVIPQEEYVQMTSMQQIRQPLAEQVYQTERDYEQNLQIKDPHRSLLLQSETIERLKGLKDQMRHYLNISTPRPYRSRAESLFQSLEPHLNVNEKGEIIKDDNSVIASSRYEDLIQHAVRDRRRNFIPTGWDYFVNLLKKHNVPKASLNRETLDELEKPMSLTPKQQVKKSPTSQKPSRIPTPKHQVKKTPTSQKPSRIPTPKRWIKSSPKSFPLSSLSLPKEYLAKSPDETKQTKTRSASKRLKQPPKKFMFTKY